MSDDRHDLDATGLRCPLPVLKARKRLKPLDRGEILRVRATDPGSPEDMRAFCAAQGHEMMRSDKEDGVFIFEIRKG